MLSHSLTTDCWFTVKYGAISLHSWISQSTSGCPPTSRSYEGNPPRGEAMPGKQCGIQGPFLRHWSARNMIMLWDSLGMVINSTPAFHQESSLNSPFCTQYHWWIPHIRSSWVYDGQPWQGSKKTIGWPQEGLYNGEKHEFQDEKQRREGLTCGPTSWFTMFDQYSSVLGIIYHDFALIVI